MSLDEQVRDLAKWITGPLIQPGCLVNVMRASGPPLYLWRAAFAMRRTRYAFRYILSSFG
jgi:hypothetical protein